MVCQVYENARKARCLDYCCVATDDNRVAAAVEASGEGVVSVSSPSVVSLTHSYALHHSLIRVEAAFMI